MTRAGGSSSDDGDTVADLMEPLARKTTLPDNACLRGLRRSVPVSLGVEVQALNERVQTGGRWHLPDLPWAVLRLAAPAGQLHAHRVPGQAMPLLRVDIRGSGTAAKSQTLARAGLPVLDAARETGSRPRRRERTGCWTTRCGSSEVRAILRREAVRRRAIGQRGPDGPGGQ